MKQVCQGKEKSKKFIETSEASFYLCSSFLYYLNRLNEGNSSEDLQIQAVKEGAEARKAESTIISLVISSFLRPVKRVPGFIQGLPR